MLREEKKGPNILIVETDTIKEALDFLETLDIKDSSNKFIFRGHTEAKWKLESTIKRYFKSSVVDPLELIERFKVGLARIGAYPKNLFSNLEWLQYARHHGVPTPVIDFTYSPYIALFFAFNGVNPYSNFIQKDDDYFVAIYVINIYQLASYYAHYIGRNEVLKGRFDYSNLSIEEKERYSQIVSDIYNSFLSPDYDKLFSNGFIANYLQLIPHPSRCNIRMLRQQGGIVI